MSIENARHSSLEQCSEHDTVDASDIHVVNCKCLSVFAVSVKPFEAPSHYQNQRSFKQQNPKL